MVSDLGLLAETARAARKNLEADRIDVVVDKGYFKIEEIEACEAAGLTPYVPKPKRSPAGPAGRFPKSSYRDIVCYVNEAVVERMGQRLTERPGLLKHRGEYVEHPFDSIKQWMGQGAFLMRRLENVRGEFGLTALVYNMRRRINLVGVATLAEAIHA